MVLSMIRATMVAEVHTTTERTQPLADDTDPVPVPAEDAAVLVVELGSIPIQEEHATPQATTHTHIRWPPTPTTAHLLARCQPRRDVATRRPHHVRPLGA